MAIDIYGGDDLEREFVSYESAKFVVIPCPYDRTATYRSGQAKGPQAIIEASANMELFDDELKIETYKEGICTLPSMDVEDLSPEEMVKAVEREISSVLKDGKMPVLIGGEHSVSVGAVEAVSGVYGNLSILHIDAHYDLRDEYEGSKFNHACVARRFLERAGVVQVGQRSLSEGEWDFISTVPAGLRTFDMYSLSGREAVSEIVESLKEMVYITIDLDGFDPSEVPGVGTPEPGGLRWPWVTGLIKEVASRKKIVGFDVVELMPIEGEVVSDFLAAKLIYRIAGYIHKLSKSGN